MRNLSYESEFCTQFHFHANQSNFHKNGFALRLALKQRPKGTRKWPIEFIRERDKNDTGYLNIQHLLVSLNAINLTIPSVVQDIIKI